MESWRHIWREGVVPLLSIRHLEVLRDALMWNDPALLQGSTTMPPPISAVIDWPVEAACALCYPAWKGDGLETVGETESYFAELCHRADALIGEPAGVRWLVEFWDSTPRMEAIEALLPEVELALAQKKEPVCA